ncbi:high affinity immunoglobulin epsilon receptor subunit beta [Sorex araneus]|uniref:high affinity immunoglobulin epsilon receptor subunit beta n=1 Tax=Sorex araneus TaxID=42254 RepID=UPI0024333D22|nr:high affinity immunoglobulin epsilon receptor subunit beta [Sorex araneus]
MDEEIRSREDIALPTPQVPSSASVIEYAEESFHDNPLLEKVTTTAPSPPRRTWMTFLQRELEFLGVTQIIIALICLCFGIIICSILNFSEVKGEYFSSFEVGFPLWGAVLFAISGILSVMCEKKQEICLVGGRLGANSISIIAAGIGIVLLTINLKKSLASIHNCLETYEDEFCFLASFSTEIVAIILCLTILEFCCAMSLTIYGVGVILKRNKIPEDGLYEEVNIYTSIYSELEDRGKTSSPTDS